MDILELLQGQAGQQIIAGTSRETGQPEDKTASVVQMALPLLMGAMKRNASDPRGAAGLLTALEDKHDGRILENLGAFFENGVDSSQKDDGSGILGHVLGGAQDNVFSALSQKSGLDSGSVQQILQVLAPIVLGFLGKEKRQNDVNTEYGLQDLLGNLMSSNKRSQQKQQSMVEALLDGNGDGSVIDDLAGMVLGGSKKKGGLLGGLFGS